MRAVQNLDARQIAPFIWLRDEGEDTHIGLNIYPARAWSRSRGFILRLASAQYYFRYSVSQRRLVHGWERR